MRPGRHRKPITLSFNPETSPNSGDLNPRNDWAAIQPGPPGGGDRTRTHQITMRYRPDVNFDTVIYYYDEVLLRTRQFNVVDFQNVDEQNKELVLLCEEVWP